MPHKHTRKGEDKATIDLPPTVVAKPLSVQKSANSNGVFTTEISSGRKSNKRKRNADKNDDTPREFARLMAFTQGKRYPKGPDNGDKPTKAQRKAKTAAAAAAAAAGSSKPAEVTSKPETHQAELLTIRPGEKMSEFSARVDAALPISGLINKTGRGGKDPLGLKVGRTKTEKRMHRMYDEWREQDRKIKEAREEALELAEAAAEEDEAATGGSIKWQVDSAAAAAAAAAATGDGTKSKASKKKKKKKVLGEVDTGDSDDADPWAALRRKRNDAPIGLHDVAQAPPQITALPREKFRVRAGARVQVDDVPRASGSLRRREELGEVRRNIVESYRQLMKAKQASAREVE